MSSKEDSTSKTIGVNTYVASTNVKPMYLSTIIASISTDYY